MTLWRQLDGSELSVDEIFLITGSLGKLWRGHRRRKWPGDTKDAFAGLLLGLRDVLMPKMDAGCVKCIHESRSDIRGIAQFLAAVARRGETVKQGSTIKNSRRVHFAPLPNSPHHAGRDDGYHNDADIKGTKEHEKRHKAKEPDTLLSSPRAQQAETDKMIKDLQVSMKLQMDELRRSLKKEMLDSMAESSEQMKIKWLELLRGVNFELPRSDG